MEGLATRRRCFKQTITIVVFVGSSCKYKAYVEHDFSQVAFQNCIPAYDMLEL